MSAPLVNPTREPMDPKAPHSVNSPSPKPPDAQEDAPGELRARLAETLRRELEMHGDAHLPPVLPGAAAGQAEGRRVEKEQAVWAASSGGGQQADGQAAGTGGKDPETVRMQLEALREGCESDPSLRTDLEGTRLVFGTGDPMSDLLLVGEAPGEQEDLEGVPFVGRAGKLLDDILKAVGSHRDRVYIANILKHRPPGNRNPTKEERERSLPVLLKQIEIVRPKMILCLGRISGATLLQNESSLAEMRGRFHPFMGAELMVTYHPAALLRNPNWKRPTWEDMQRLRDRYRERGCRPEMLV